VGRGALVIVSLLALAGGAPPAAATPILSDLPGLLEPRATPPLPWVDLRTGIAGGGSAFLTPLGGPVNETTARLTAVAFVRLRLPRLTGRSIEAYGVWPHGVGLTLKNDDLHLGRLWLHLLDVGVFYASRSPITLQRVERTWDATVGMSAELDLPRRLTATADVRLFAPLDIIGVLTRHGDASRLIGEEIAKGGQLWLGVSYRW
jgi:hypothetical protein